MTEKWGQACCLMFILTIIVVMFSGCTSIFPHIDDGIQDEPSTLDRLAFENALTVYARDDFSVALGRFRALAITSTDKTIVRQAQLGEVCCHLMLADSASDYAFAIDMWQAFDRSALDNDATSALTLFDPLIIRLGQKETIRVIEVQAPAAQTTTKSTPPTNRPQALRDLQTEIADLKKKAQDTAKLQGQLDKIRAENRTLKAKIKALETIDQNIQKKKTEIAAPSELKDEK